MERLQKIIAQSGYCSRRKAEELISAGKVTVNGEVVDVLGTKVTGKEEICVNGQIISKEEKKYFLFYKPKGVVTTMHDEKGRPCVADFFSEIDERVYPVGRLDYDTTGALFMTNDGDFANLMMHPSSHIDKIYEVVVDGHVSEETKKSLERGIYIEGVKTLPCRIKINGYNENVTMLMIKLQEGKNRQVKKMFEAAGHEVKRLHRMAIGPVTLKGLEPGTARRLTPHEVGVLVNLAKTKKSHPKNKNRNKSKRK